MLRCSQARESAGSGYVEVCKYFWQKDAGSHPGGRFEPLRYMKLLYLSHAFHLLLGEKSFLGKDLFEAWMHGPVLPELYEDFSGDGSYEFMAQLGAGVPKLSSVTAEVLEFVWNRYGGLSAWDLISVTHTGGGPWDSNYEGHRRPNTIPDSDILEHYDFVFNRSGD